MIGLLLGLACRHDPPPVDFAALATDARAAADRCAMDERTSVDGLTVADLMAACGSFEPLYDQRARRMIGRSTEGDTLVAAVARMADDVSHLHRTLVREDHPGEAQIMVDHIRVSSGDLRALLERATAWPLRLPGCASRDELALLRDNGQIRVENLATTLRHYGTVHKGHPELVRNRMLEVYGLSAAAWLSDERGRWGPGCPGYADAAPLLDALGGVVDTFERARATLRSGEVETDEAAEGIERSLDAPIAAWTRALGG